MRKKDMKTADAPLTIGDACAAFEGGRKVCRGAVKIADLRGTWFEMGRQYGALASEELNEVCAFVGRIAAASPENAVSADRICAVQVRQMPYSIRRFFAGAAETSGLTVPQLYFANAVEYIAGLPQCSALAAWGDYADGALVFGRNYDYGEAFLELNRDVLVTVFHPADGSLSTAIVGYAGEIYAVNGMNEKGIFLELNNGTPSTRMAPLATRIAGTTSLFDVLFKADTLDYLDLFFETVLCSDSYTINAADGAEARSYEWCLTGARRADSCAPKGLLASTNHYLHPDWPFPLPADGESWQSITRRKNLLAIAEAGKGRFDAAVMCAALDRRIEDGGVTDELTVYQLVAVPERRALWIKVTGASEWTEIDLGSFFA